MINEHYKTINNDTTYGNLKFSLNNTEKPMKNFERILDLLSKKYNLSIPSDKYNDAYINSDYDRLKIITSSIPPSKPPSKQLTLTGPCVNPMKTVMTRMASLKCSIYLQKKVLIQYNAR